MKSHNDKELLFSLVFITLLAGLGGSYFERNPIHFSNTNDINSAAAILATEQNLAPTITTRPVTLGFVGDIMLDRGIKASVIRNFGGDYNKMFTKSDFLKVPDITFANLEGPVSNKGTDQHNLYSFRMDPSIIPAIKNAGIDVVSFANNHVGDYGREAFEDSLTRLHNAGILTCGAGMNRTEAETPAIVSQNNFSVGYLCFSDVGPDTMAVSNTQSGILLTSDPDFDSIIQKASQKVSALIVSFHFGIEYQTTHTVRQEDLANRAINDGAAMIVGAHPHVPEDIGSLNGAPIFYSLGNFIFDQPFSKETMGGLFITAKIQNKTVSDIISHTIELNKNFVPSLVQ